MPRELTSHKVNGCNDGIKVEVLDEPGSGGASHRYLISIESPTLNPHDPEGFSPVNINFQNGPIKEAGINGVTHENLVAILIDRFEGFQTGPYACAENAEVLELFQRAQTAMKRRTEARLARGVEGTHKV